MTTNWRYRQWYGDWLGRTMAWLSLATCLPSLLALIYAMIYNNLPPLPGLSLSLVLIYGLAHGVFWLLTNRQEDC